MVLKMVDKSKHTSTFSFDVDESDGEIFEHNESSSDSDEDAKASEHYITVGKSKLRDSSVRLGENYTGKLVSRKDLFGTGELEDDDDGNSTDTGSNITSEGSQNGSESDSSISLRTDSEDEEIEDNYEDTKKFATDKSATEVQQRKKLQELITSENKNMINRITNSTITDIKKGFAAKHQHNVFENILDARINFQKSLTASNTFPMDLSTISRIKDDIDTGSLSKIEDNLYSLLNGITKIRKKLMVSDKVVSSKDKLPKISKKRNLETAFNNVSNLDRQLEAYRDVVLTRWSQKVQSASGSLNSSKFKTINQSAAVQVNSGLADMSRLIKRSRLNRAGITPIGYVSTETDGKKSTKIIVDSNLHENEHIFDDSDFYGSLLRELVDKRMVDTNASNTLQWTVSKTKVKKNVDTKASKGRKLRYTVQEKLQNYEPPRPDYYPMDNNEIDELFGGLLGQKVNLRNDNSEGESGNEAEEDIADTGLQIFG